MTRRTIPRHEPPANNPKVLVTKRYTPPKGTFPGVRAHLRYPKEDVAKQKALVEEMMTLGYNAAAIRKQARLTWPVFGIMRTQRFMNEVRDRWVEETKQRSKEFREGAIRRAFKHLQKSMRTDNVEFIKFAEMHLAKILGYYAADKLDLRGERGQVFDQALAQMSQEELDEMASEYRETMLLAARAKDAGLEGEES